MYNLFLKRGLDIMFSSLWLVVFSPIIAVISLILAMSYRGDPFFYQRRPGKNTRIFTIIKFKSMTDAKDFSGKLLPDNERLTKIGQFVRKTSLDEIPQLINVLKGDMSLVGPRPLRAEYLPLYSNRQMKRHSVKPGITGWAQINGRNAIDWETKFEYDVWYVENMSSWLDLRILWLTVMKVVKRDGVSDAHGELVKPFKGANTND
jgi:undecaprenyl phosphate N,N'-diacetylbacillosamine 1-phosphate transferase